MNKIVVASDSILLVGYQLVRVASTCMILLLSFLLTIEFEPSLIGVILVMVTSWGFMEWSHWSWASAARAVKGRR